MKQYKYILISALVLLGFTSCEDFLDRPTEDSYTIDSFYQTNEQCYQAANTLYNSPWYDFQRGFISVGERLSGNIYSGNNPYVSFTLNGTDEDLVNMSASLWSVNAYCNSVVENINTKAGPAVSDEVKKAVKGEALTWKAMAYFYLVRIWGAVPIIHNNTDEIAKGKYNQIKKATVENVYDYIIMTLEQAIEWLPETAAAGRIDRYSAYGLLSKVYLTKSGLGKTSQDPDDLAKAAEYALKVIEESGRQLEPNYSDIFRLAKNTGDESLIAWRWVTSIVWTSQNTLQSDLAIEGFSEFADTWGGWTGPTVDLQDAFGENALSTDRQNRDSRRKATMMMYGDKYEYFWADKGGFDVADHYMNTLGAWQCGTGANCVKHLVGNENDHLTGIGHAMDRMATSLATHILRLSDVYLVYAEAALKSNPELAVKYFNMIRSRAGVPELSTITWEDVWKERRLELACEGDRWYDYVRWHYFEPQKAINELKNQRRSTYTGLDSFYESGSLDPSSTYYDRQPTTINVNDSHFELPFPDTDKLMNPNLMLDPEDIDISQFTY
ncbi:RagB/SusD family nutrient uptake outer membrane protein [Bacteroidales bacterium OttesenSCG-928-A17]|nr:RagB/SusD family nutrient uptake outer membrane protein [Bacteroidales bacterium OttesenSCG-928-A17]